MWAKLVYWFRYIFEAFRSGSAAPGRTSRSRAPRQRNPWPRCPRCFHRYDPSVGCCPPPRPTERPDSREPAEHEYGADYAQDGGDR